MNHQPTLENFKLQIEEKSKNFPIRNREILVNALLNQHQKFEISAQTLVEDLDESIIGGFVLQGNNKIIDTSIRSQLQQLKNNLK